MVSNGQSLGKPRCWWRVGCRTDGMTSVGWGTGFVGRIHLAGWGKMEGPGGSHWARSCKRSLEICILNGVI